MTLTSAAVEETFLACLAGADPDYVAVEGVVSNFGLSKTKLAENRSKIEGWIAELADEFHTTKGGGMSFLRLCLTRDGEQWTGLHRSQEQLYVLAAGLGLARFVLPREMWSALPGGVPYIAFDSP